MLQQAKDVMRKGKILKMTDKAHQHAQEHLAAAAKYSQNTEIAKGTFTFPDTPDGSGMVRDPDSGTILFVGFLVHNETLNDGGYLLVGGNEDADGFMNKQLLENIIQGLFIYMQNRPLIELQILEPTKLCELQNLELNDANTKACTFVILGFQQAFAQYLQNKK